MSTILEALRELEGTPPPAVQEQTPWSEGSRRLGILAAVAAVTLVAGAVLLVLALRPGTPARVASPSLVPEVRPPAAAPPAPRVAAPPERPWGFVQTKPAEPAPVERPAARVAAARAAERPAAPAPVAPAADPPVTRIIGAPRVPPARPVADPPPRPVGAPHVRVTGLSYAGSRSERVAALAIDGATPVTLHEGESAGGVEVQLILPDRIYVRSGPNVFAVDAQE